MTKKKYFIILGSFIIIMGILALVYVLIPHEAPPEVIDYGEEYLKYSKIFELNLSEDKSYYSINKLILSDDEIEIPNTIDNIPVKKWYLDSGNGISFKNVRVVKIPANIDFIGSINSTEFSFISTSFSELVAYVVDENNEVFCSVDGVIYSKDKLTLYRYPNKKNPDSTSYTINDYVTTIYKNSFCYNTNLQSIKIGKNVITIESDAFRDCSNLIGVSFNDNLKVVSSFAFYQCNLKTVELPESIETIMSNSFCGNVELAYVYIGSNIKNVGRNAFSRHAETLKIYTPSSNVANLKTLIQEEDNEGYKTIILEKTTE